MTVTTITTESPDAASCPSHSVPAPWAGTATAAPGLLAFTGEIGTAEVHAHAAVQVLVVTAGRVRLRDPDGQVTQVSVAIIPPGARHELHAAPGAIGLLAYLDPASRAGRAAASRVHAAGDPGRASTWQAAARTLTRAFPSGEVVTPAGLSRTLLSCELPGPAAAMTAATPPPAALQRALALIPQLISGPLLLHDLASRLNRATCSAVGGMRELGLLAAAGPVHLVEVGRLQEAGELPASCASPKSSRQSPRFRWSAAGPGCGGGQGSSARRR